MKHIGYNEVSDLTITKDWGKIVGKVGEKNVSLWHIWNVERSDDYNWGVYLFADDTEPTDAEIIEAFVAMYGGGEKKFIEQMVADKAYFKARVYTVNGMLPQYRGGEA